MQGQEIFLYEVSGPHRLLSIGSGVEAAWACCSLPNSIYCKDYESVERHVYSPYISSRRGIYLSMWTVLPSPEFLQFSDGDDS
jgi:hypothetical protein